MPNDFPYRPADRPTGDGIEEASLSTLLRQLADESAALLRNEARLAKLELREATATMAKGGVKIAVAAGFATLGALALTACLIILIGNALDGAYWAGALIVAGLFFLAGALLARNALTSMQKGATPDDTIRSLRENQRFLRQELHDFRDELAS